MVAALILKGGFDAAVDTISPLLGQAPSPELVEAVEKLVMAHREIVGIHDLVVHDYGPGRLMITLHAEVPADGDMLELHDVVDTVERELAVRMRCVATIHMDPVVTDETTVHLRQDVAELVKTVDPRITIHDFRMVPGPSHTNLIFDAIVPLTCPWTRERWSGRSGKRSGRCPETTTLWSTRRTAMCERSGNRAKKEGAMAPSFRYSHFSQISGW